MPGGVTLPEQTRNGGLWGIGRVPQNSRRREQQFQNIPAAEGRQPWRELSAGVEDPGSSNSAQEAEGHS